MTNTLVIDAQVRDWVLIPLTVFIVLYKLVTQYAYMVRSAAHVPSNNQRGPAEQ